MAEKKKEPMIGKESRPTAIDYDAPISNWKVRDLTAVISAQIFEHLKYTPIPEYMKPEKELGKPEKELLKPEKERMKPEQLKPEKELYKPEKEQLKPEKERMKPERFKPEQLKPEKEFYKPEKEGMKPEKELEPDLVEMVAARVVEMLEKRGLIK